MSVVVEHEESQALYVLVGAGYSLLPGGMLTGTTAHDVVACCDRDGVIHWFESRELLVVLVDGKDPEDILDEAEGLVYVRQEDVQQAVVSAGEPVSDVAVEPVTAEADTAPAPDPDERWPSSGELWGR